MQTSRSDSDRLGPAEMVGTAMLDDMAVVLTALADSLGGGRFDDLPSGFGAAGTRLATTLRGLGITDADRSWDVFADSERVNHRAGRQLV